MKICRALEIMVVLGVVAAHDFPSHICVSWLSLRCIGGDRALTNTQVRLTYNYSVDGVLRNTSSRRISKKCGINVTFELSYPDLDVDELNANVSRLKATYLFEQLEHGGGQCNCVDLYFDNCTSNNRLEHGNNYYYVQVSF